jgi:hypothetical protein
MPTQEAPFPRTRGVCPLSTHPLRRHEPGEASFAVIASLVFPLRGLNLKLFLKACHCDGAAK